MVSRVTKFKINWDSNSTENSENIPPKTEPIQMSSENSPSLEGPLKSGGQTSGLQAAERMEMDCPGSSDNKPHYHEDPVTAMAALSTTLGIE